MKPDLIEAVQKIYDAIEEAEKISLETGEDFGLSVEYGMGGYFDPTEENDETGSHWFPSSLSC